MIKKYEIINIYIFTIVIILTVIAYWNVQTDDSYIFYKYAKNIAYGNGYVFNIGEKINATTSPLYPLVLAFLYFLINNFVFVSIPLIGHLIGGFSLWVISFFSMKILQKEGFRESYYFFPLVFLSIPLIRNAVGMETFLTLSLIILSLYFYQRNSYKITFLFGALSVLSRYDSILIVLILIVDYLITKQKLVQWKSILIFFLTIVPWFIFSYFYFDSLIPSSVSVKLVQQQTHFWGSGFIFLKGFFYVFPGGQTISIFFVLVITVLVLINIFFNKSFLKRKLTLLILIWSLIYFIIYSFVINPPPYPWYYTPFAIGIGLIIILMIEFLISKNLLKFNFIPIALIVLIFSSSTLPIKTYIDQPTPKYENYKTAADWLNKNAKEGDSIVIDEIGILGYYYEKGKIIDILGLINPNTIQFLKQKKYNEIIDLYNPNYVITDYPKPPIYENFIFTKDFNEKYNLATIISGGYRKVSVYKRIY